MAKSMMTTSEMFSWLGDLQLNWWQALIFLVVIFLGFSVMSMIKNKNFELLKFFKRKRTQLIRCVDCVQILNNKSYVLYTKQRELYTNEEKLRVSILRKQMVFAEEKIDEIEGKFLAFYNNIIEKSMEKSPKKTEITEYRMYWGLVKSCMRSVHQKIRSSFKENGFSEESGDVFSKTVKNKSKNIISILDKEIINLYPTTEEMIVSSKNILSFIDGISPEIEDVVFEIYGKAKKIKKEQLEKIKVLHDEYKKERKEYEDSVESYTKTLEQNRNF